MKPGQLSLKFTDHLDSSTIAPGSLSFFRGTVARKRFY
jgi:hypothetical protein